MTIIERKTTENQAYTLINRINSHYEPEVSNSVMILHGGIPTNISSFELEALLDDLLTIENECD